MILQTLQQTFIYKVMVVGLSCGLTMSATADLGKVSTLVNNGIATAQATVGHMYLTGEGISQDDVKAFERTKEAAYRGRAFSQYALGELYSNGTGVRQNDTKAIEWYEKAAK
ncbi:tetratricopeptide repeat protein, partial [Psychrobacter alimentarius]|uniref:tetratricopeptide repeat protein n=1 Tax=Psychrobacter alimentarius TaxID=261164 RepID=UPI003FD05A37